MTFEAISMRERRAGMVLYGLCRRPDLRSLLWCSCQRTVRRCGSLVRLRTMFCYGLCSRAVIIFMQRWLGDEWRPLRWWLFRDLCYLGGLIYTEVYLDFYKTRVPYVHGMLTCYFKNLEGGRDIWKSVSAWASFIAELD